MVFCKATTIFVIIRPFIIIKSFSSLILPLSPFLLSISLLFLHGIRANNLKSIVYGFLKSQNICPYHNLCPYELNNSRSVKNLKNNESEVCVCQAFIRTTLCNNGTIHVVIATQHAKNYNQEIVKHK